MSRFFEPFTDAKSLHDYINESLQGNKKRKSPFTTNYFLEAKRQELREEFRKKRNVQVNKRRQDPLFTKEELEVRSLRELQQLLIRLNTFHHIVFIDMKLVRDITDENHLGYMMFAAPKPFLNNILENMLQNNPRVHGFHQKALNFLKLLHQYSFTRSLDDTTTKDFTVTDVYTFAERDYQDILNSNPKTLDELIKDRMSQQTRTFLKKYSVFSISYKRQFDDQRDKHILQFFVGLLDGYYFAEKIRSLKHLGEYMKQSYEGNRMAPDTLIYTRQDNIPSQDESIQTISDGLTNYVVNIPELKPNIDAFLHKTLTKKNLVLDKVHLAQFSSINNTYISFLCPLKIALQIIANLDPTVYITFYDIPVDTIQMHPNEFIDYLNILISVSNAYHRDDPDFLNNYIYYYPYYGLFFQFFKMPLHNNLVDHLKHNKIVQLFIYQRNHLAGNIINDFIVAAAASETIFPSDLEGRLTYPQEDQVTQMMFSHTIDCYDIRRHALVPPLLMDYLRERRIETSIKKFNNKSELVINIGCFPLHSAPHLLAEHTRFQVAYPKTNQLFDLFHQRLMVHDSHTQENVRTFKFEVQTQDSILDKYPTNSVVPELYYVALFQFNDTNEIFLYKLMENNDEYKIDSEDINFFVNQDTERILRISSEPRYKAFSYVTSSITIKQQQYLTNYVSEVAYNLYIKTFKSGHYLENHPQRGYFKQQVKQCFSSIVLNFDTEDLQQQYLHPYLVNIFQLRNIFEKHIKYFLGNTEVFNMLYLVCYTDDGRPDPLNLRARFKDIVYSINLRNYLKDPHNVDAQLMKLKDKPIEEDEDEEHRQALVEQDTKLVYSLYNNIIAPFLYTVVEIWYKQLGKFFVWFDSTRPEVIYTQFMCWFCQNQAIHAFFTDLFTGLHKLHLMDVFHHDLNDHNVRRSHTNNIQFVHFYYQDTLMNTINNNYNYEYHRVSRNESIDRFIDRLYTIKNDLQRALRTPNLGATSKKQAREILKDIMYVELLPKSPEIQEQHDFFRKFIWRINTPVVSFDRIFTDIEYNRNIHRWSLHPPSNSEKNLFKFLYDYKVLPFKEALCTMYADTLLSTVYKDIPGDLDYKTPEELTMLSTFIPIGG
jgi:hypothetical protein